MIQSGMRLSSVAQLDTAPATEPLTTSEAKSHVRVDHTDDDTFIDSLITAVRVAVENETNRKMISQTWKIAYPHFHDPMILPFADLTSVSSITYYDQANAQQTLSTDVYEVDTQSMVGQIHLGYAQVWPTTYLRHDAVEITYVVGYADASSVPQPLKQAMLLMLGHYYENRESVAVGVNTMEIPMAYKHLLSPYRVMW